MPADEKYIVFKRSEFYELMGELALPETGDCAPVAERIIQRAEETALPDAVVLRTQDELAYAPILVYLREAEQHNLWGVAEYFTKRAMEADDRERKYPD